jgi:hypothetical protein
MKNRAKVLTLSVLLFCLPFGCAPKMTWTSDPMKQVRGNEAYEVTLEPIKQENEFFVAFRISVKNKTDSELKIDWNNSQYIHGGKSQGGFLFKGIDPEMLKNRNIPVDIIPPHGMLTKEIAPAKKVAWAPMRTSSTSKPGLSLGILPPGENGVLLSVSRNGKDIPQQIAVKITEQTAK